MMRLLTPVLLFLVAAIADAQTLRVLNTYKVLCDMTLVVLAIITTVENIDQIADGSAVDVWVKSAVLP